LCQTRNETMKSCHWSKSRCLPKRQPKCCGVTQRDKEQRFFFHIWFTNVEKGDWDMKFLDGCMTDELELGGSSRSRWQLIKQAADPNSGLGACRLLLNSMPPFFQDYGEPRLTRRFPPCATYAIIFTPLHSTLYTQCAHS
jgi:hypothetical protein